MEDFKCNKRMLEDLGVDTVNVTLRCNHISKSTYGERVLYERNESGEME